MPKFAITESDGFTSILPEGFELKEFGSYYLKYLNTLTGEIADCEVFANQLKDSYANPYDRPRKHN